MEQPNCNKKSLLYISVSFLDNVRIRFDSEAVART